uniref:Polygalacturonase 1 n=1 Tax=Solanum tuberosum TaxID=4113 RepID=M1A9G5_SOLTU
MSPLAIFFLFLINSSLASNTNYNVQNYGAKSDGETDSSEAFLSAWSAACASTRSSTIYVPRGNYLIRNAYFNGKTCQSKAITIRIDGTLLAPSDYNVIGNDENWIKFEKVNGISIYGGTFDGQGAALWACKKSNNKKCPDGTTSSGVSIVNSQIGTGDDCVSIGPGTSNLWIEGIACGPGHGISIGSLGWKEQELGVQNVTIKTVTFSGTTNGVRVKTWARPSNGFVRNVLFQHIVMVNVKNPIIIDQNYCPNHESCPHKGSGVKISDVTYQDIHGTSATKVAVKLNCSKSNPCSGITLEDVNLSYNDHPTKASCVNVSGRVSGLEKPANCL